MGNAQYSEAVNFFNSDGEWVTDDELESKLEIETDKQKQEKTAIVK